MVTTVFFITKSWEQFKCPITEDKLRCPLKYNPAYNTSDISEGIFVVLMLCSERVKVENRMFIIVSIIHAHTYTERGKNEKRQDVNNKYLHDIGL